MMSICAGERRGPWSKASVIVLGLGAAVLLGGCNNAMKDENAALMQENAQLREQNTQYAANQAALQEQLSRMQAPQPPIDQFAPPDRGVTARDTSRGEIVIEIAGDVLFDSGQATLKSSARKELDTVASRIKGRHSGRSIRIEGHTDSDPIRRSKWGSNEALSQARADAVRDYLVTKGISRSSISTVGMGASQPKGSKAASRRVEVVIVDQ